MEKVFICAHGLGFFFATTQEVFEHLLTAMGSQWNLLIRPFPDHALPEVLDLLRKVPAPLVQPFLTVLLDKFGVAVANKAMAAKNVVCKLTPLIMADGVASHKLKDIQTWSDSPTMLVCDKLQGCPLCGSALRTEPSRSTFAQQIPPGMSFEPSQGPTRFRVFTLAAGLQPAAFQHKHCDACSRSFLKGWSWKSLRGANVDCRWVGPMPESCFILPKQRSWIGIDGAMLAFITAELLHNPSSFASILRVWSDMHPEHHQQHLILGEHGTLERNNTLRMEDLFLCYQATRLAEGRGSHIVWDFTSRSGLDKAFCEYAPILQENHFASVVAHMDDCPRCQKLVAIITDGKCGAKRRVCANMDRFTLLPNLQVALQTGCMQHAPSGRLYCAECSRKHTGDVAAAGQIRILGTTIVSAQGVRLCYRVQHENGAVRTLSRAQVNQNLLEDFECLRPLKRRRRGNQGTKTARRRRLVHILKATSVKAKPARAKPSAPNGSWSLTSDNPGFLIPKSRHAKVHCRVRDSVPLCRQASFEWCQQQPCLQEALRFRPIFCDLCFTKIDKPSQKLIADTLKAVADEEVAKRAILSLPADQSASQPSQNFPQEKKQHKQQEVVYRRGGPQKYPKGRAKAARIQATSAGCCDTDEPTTLSEGWIAIGSQDLDACPCNVEKDAGPTRKRRRTTGGMQTFLLHCGVLLHWVEIYRGESLQLIYAELLGLLQRLQQLNRKIDLVLYDNACKLLTLTRAKRHCYLPLTETLAQTKFCLDAFHRNNHVWCLQHLPEVDPQAPNNQTFMSGINSQACEEYNCFLTNHTPVALEMTGGRYHIYYWTLARLKNDRLLSERAKLRARFARGFMQQDPDVPRQSPPGSA